MSYLCPKCKGKTIVIDSRRNPKNQVRRRRKCIKCSNRFSTVEIIKTKKSVEEGYKKSSEENVAVAEEMEDFENDIDDMDDEVDAKTKEMNDMLD